jgi:hypothetical protein
MIVEMSCSAILRRGAAIFVALLILSACGAGPPFGFVNHTRHTDAQLRAIWTAAQQSLSQQIDLNPVQRVFQNAPPDIRPGDARVWDISPRRLAVGSQADVSSSAFYAATGDLRIDPTGLIACPQPCNVNYAAAYSLFRRPAVRYAASWEASESNFDYLLTYEFENQILNALGYDMRWR